jgi:hypothetical protein
VHKKLMNIGEGGEGGGVGEATKAICKSEKNNRPSKGNLQDMALKRVAQQIAASGAVSVCSTAYSTTSQTLSLAELACI